MEALCYNVSDKTYIRRTPMSNIITQDLLFKQSVVKFAIKHNNNSKAAIKFNLTREYVRFWRKRYDGTIDSLRKRSTAPINPRNRQSIDQIDIVRHTYKHNKVKQVIQMFVIARRKGYKYSYYTFASTIRKLFGVIKVKKNKYIPMKYDTPIVPGEKVQLDVKYVPKSCYNNKEERWCQYTFIDEATRIRYLYPARESNSYESVKALDSAIIYFAKLGIKIQLIQTDNGPEFTNRFLSETKLGYFELTLTQYGLEHYTIKAYTPRHNGKVERSHRNDNERFYSKKKFKSFSDFSHKLSIHNKNYNHFPILSKKLKTPIEILKSLKTL